MSETFEQQVLRIAKTVYEKEEQGWGADEDLAFARALAAEWFKEPVAFSAAMLDRGNVGYVVAFVDIDFKTYLYRKPEGL